jgi:hypothetical protein
MVDGIQVSPQSISPAANGECALYWDTTYAHDGNHTVQIELYSAGSDYGGAGRSLLVTTTAIAPLFEFPLRPEDSGWASFDPLDRIDFAQIPQDWKDTATEWQKFCSGISSPFFRASWVPGVSMNACYTSAKQLYLPILAELESSDAYGQNVLRYISRTDPAPLATMEQCPADSPCMIDYVLLCHMAGLDTALNQLNQSDLQRLFKMAVWDANYITTTDSYDAMAAAAVDLMYKVYTRLSQPPVTLAALTPDQISSLDMCELPSELQPTVASAKSSMNLTSRPQ